MEFIKTNHTRNFGLFKEFRVMRCNVYEVSYGLGFWFFALMVCVKDVGKRH